MDAWLLLQLGDSAFPAGGFAHSGGLEAAVQLGEIAGAAGARAFAEQALWQAGHGALPFVRAAIEAPLDLAKHDALCDAFLTSRAANTASRTQGRALVSTCARVFPIEPVSRLEAAVRGKEIAGHHAPIFGAALGALGASARDAQRLYLHLALRGVSSAAVRLGLVGPHEAQRVHRELSDQAERVLDACGPLGLDAIAQPAPLVDLFGSLHDRLYARLFLS